MQQDRGEKDVNRVVGGRDRHKAQRERKSEPQISDRGSQAWREKDTRHWNLGESTRILQTGLLGAEKLQHRRGQGDPEGRLGETQGPTRDRAAGGAASWWAGGPGLEGTGRWPHLCARLACMGHGSSREGPGSGSS